MEGSPQPERDALRSAVHDELIDLLVEGGYMRNAMRSEVEAALWRWSQASKRSVPEHSKRVETSDCAGQALASRAGPRAPSNPKETPPEAPSAPGSGVDIGTQPHKECGSLEVASVEFGRDSSDNDSSSSMDAAAVAHFSKFVKSVETTIPECFVPEVGDMIFVHRLRQKAADFWDWLQNIEPPAPAGRVAHFTTGKFFEGAITVTIIINSVWMMYVADAKIKDPYRDDSWAFAGDCVFQAIYTIEMAMKLWVFRHWFFCSESWRINVFELALVGLGFLSLVTATSSVSFLRVLRILEIGRASRVLRAMTHFKHLRALMVCIQGSISSLMWSLFMVILVYSIFALFLVQIITGHLMETGKVVEETFFFDSFGSIAQAMLTLHMACTGGLGWEVAYEQIETTGVMGSVIYLIFIVFVNFALMNIIQLPAANPANVSERQHDTLQ
ncbi:unnamed protein product [Prorocentrum cordatum]|uniref:Ion transport domain-containing protein n=2 Tax=Prorocentrum cordatum TaxID=2364126 RepID=A0ABN9UG48_9DINO|nr:unnamed protein product [Polarella glacialis]